MKRFYIVANPDKENTKNMKTVIERYLKYRGAEAFVAENLPGHGNPYTDPADVPENAECVITLGGDGTLIQAARDLAKRDLPIIGINMGGLGYLTQIGREGDVKELLDALLEDRYELQERMMLKGCIYRKGKPLTESIALNDILLTRDGEPRVLKLDLYVDGQFLNEFSADGMIVATPTGSTAYNLSAGGPIAQPDGKLMILTPVCPHTLTSRSIVFNAKSRIRIEIPETNRGSQVAAFDGDTLVRLENGDSIEITKAETVTRMVKLDHRSFLDILKTKMYDA